MSLLDPAPVSLQAFVTTLHLALASLRNHRSATHAISSLAIISVLFGILPWVLTSPVGLAIGVVLHFAWFGGCELFARPASTPRGGRRAPTTTRPSTPDPAIARPAAVKRPTEFVQVPVLAAFDETPDIRTFRLSRPQGFDFESGQFIVIRFRTDGRDHARCYSISSAPEARGYLEVSVKRQGAVSSALHAALRPGATLFVRTPAGAFVYPAGEDRPIVLLAGGVGITPLMSMLRHGLAVEPTRPMTLLYSAQQDDGHAFRDELEALARRHPQLRVRFTVTRATNRTDCYRGRIDERLIRTEAPEIRHSISLICGPRQMIDDLKTLLGGFGVPSSQVRSEYFEAAVAASTRVRSARESGNSDALSRTSGTTREPIEVTFEKSGISGHARRGQTLLEAAEANGVAIPHLCRAGVCGTCRTRVINGQVVCNADLLNETERQQGVVLACVSSVEASCTVEA
jgi:ferredoxin-NADP reductase